MWGVRGMQFSLATAKIMLFSEMCKFLGRKMKEKTEIFGNFERKRKKTESEGSEM